MDIFLSIKKTIKIAVYYKIINYIHYMEEQKIKIKVSSIIKKFKTKQDIFDYCREQSNVIF